MKGLFSLLPEAKSSMAIVLFYSLSYVAVKPAVVNIALAEDEIYAGRAVSARCETWGSSPAARIVWRLAGLVIRESSLTIEQRSNSTASKMALVLDKDDDGKELSCRAENPRFPGGVLERTKVLRVLCEYFYIYIAVLCVVCTQPLAFSIIISFPFYNSFGVPSCN